MSEKALEALRNIQANTYYVDKHGNEQHVYPPDDAQFELIRKALTPQTAEEVCEALSEYFGFEVVYEGLGFFPKERLSYIYRVVAMVDGCIDFADPLPPHLVDLIGGFYEGVEYERKQQIR